MINNLERRSLKMCRLSIVSRTKTFNKDCMSYKIYDSKFNKPVRSWKPNTYKCSNSMKNIVSKVKCMNSMNWCSLIFSTSISSLIIFYPILVPRKERIWSLKKHRKYKLKLNMSEVRNNKFSNVSIHSRKTALTLCNSTNRILIFNSNNWI